MLTVCNVDCRDPLLFIDLTPSITSAGPTPKIHIGKHEGIRRRSNGSKVTPVTVTTATDGATGYEPPTTTVGSTTNRKPGQKSDHSDAPANRISGDSTATDGATDAGTRTGGSTANRKPGWKPDTPRMAPQMNNQVNLPVGHTRAIPAIPATPPPVYLPIGKSHGDILTKGLNNMDLNGKPTVSQSALGSSQCACRSGTTSTAKSVYHNPTSGNPSEDLKKALFNGQVDLARRLLANGVLIDRWAPRNIIFAPEDRQIPLFELLMQYGWTLNTPGPYGAVLLPSIVTNDVLLDWFLAHGADPNLGKQPIKLDIEGGSNTRSCKTLEVVAFKGSFSAVQKLLKAGAKVQNGAPLYYAAAHCPYDNWFFDKYKKVTPSKALDDAAQIPIMALLVKNGADVNQARTTPHKTTDYPIVHAIKIGAFERVKWLLRQGANPDQTGAALRNGQESVDDIGRAPQVDIKNPLSVPS
ncbi:hypothetical protein NW762_007911 [Fusarium torreyae]|uniref:Ankyrin n=1 Tax=Fusarium torreyae TaxID=1237075 RepID=A0A9W8VDA7_9HYPO|nr:hypothetical protein NW762_007911 [Fusarium torreyae]